jgi:hypothetical protein
MARMHRLANASLNTRTAISVSRATWRLRSGRLPWRSRRAERRRRRRARASFLRGLRPQPRRVLRR